MDSASGLYNAIIGQSEDQYYDEYGKLIYDSNPAVKDAWDTAAEASEAGLTREARSSSTRRGTRRSRNGAFATIACPAWMIGYIKGQAGDAGAGQVGRRRASRATAATGAARTSPSRRRASTRRRRTSCQVADGAGAAGEDVDEVAALPVELDRPRMRPSPPRRTSTSAARRSARSSRSRPTTSRSPIARARRTVSSRTRSRTRSTGSSSKATTRTRRGRRRWTRSRTRSDERGRGAVAIPPPAAPRLGPAPPVRPLPRPDGGTVGRQIQASTPTGRTGAASAWRRRRLTKALRTRTSPRSSALLRLRALPARSTRAGSRSTASAAEHRRDGVGRPRQLHAADPGRVLLELAHEHLHDRGDLDGAAAPIALASPTSSTTGCAARRSSASRCSCRTRPPWPRRRSSSRGSSAATSG